MFEEEAYDFFDTADDYEGNGGDTGGGESTQEMLPQTSTEATEDLDPTQSTAGAEPPSQDEDFQAQIASQTQKRVDEFYKRQFGSVVNPLTGAPIASEGEYISYQEALAQEEQYKQLEAAGIHPQIIAGMIDNHPAVKAAQAFEVQNFADQQFSQLLKKFPDCEIARINDLETTAEGRACLKDWASTGDLGKAYAANFSEKIIERRVAAAKQGALNSANNKNHIAQPAGGGNAKTMSREDMASWKQFYPNLTESQIEAKWKKVEDDN